MAVPSPAPPARRLAPTIVLLVVGVALIGFFGFRVYHNYTRFQQFRRAPETVNADDLRDWMTLPYIGHAYGVPPDALFDALGLPKAGNEHLSLQQLAANSGRTTQDLRQALQQAIQSYRPPHPPPPGAHP